MANRKALYEAAGSGKTDVVRGYIAKGVNVNWGNPEHHKMTPLAMAVKGGHIEVAKILIAAGADVNLAADDGATSLIAAAYRGRLDMVKLLLEHNANEQLADSDGKPIDQVCLARTADILHKGAITKLLR